MVPACQHGTKCEAFVPLTAKLIFRNAIHFSHIVELVGLLEGLGCAVVKSIDMKAAESISLTSGVLVSGVPAPTEVP